MDFIIIFTGGYICFSFAYIYKGDGMSDVQDIFLMVVLGLVLIFGVPLWIQYTAEPKTTTINGCEFVYNPFMIIHHPTCDAETHFGKR